jgi:hypothetical protein
MRRLFVFLTLLTALSLVVAGCGKDDEEEGEEAGADETCTAAPPALTGATNLAANFPIPDDVVITSTAAAGPSTVAKGYAEADLKDVYESFKDELDHDPYSVTKSEKDAHDAEVNFAGEGTSGQVRLGEECKGRTSVQITSRPG